MRSSIGWPVAKSMLQRGRDQLIAEMGSTTYTGPIDVLASTGPRSTDRGNQSPRCADPPKIEASTGPRSTDRGNAASESKRSAANVLQRGRDQLIAEMGCKRSG